MEVSFNFNSDFEDEIIYNSQNTVDCININLENLDNDTYSIEINYENQHELNRYHRNRGIRIDLTFDELDDFDQILEDLIEEHVMMISNQNLEKKKDETITLDLKTVSEIKLIEQCVVCMELENETDNCEGYKLKCNHIIHKSCLSNWVKYNQTCPVCRYPVDTYFKSSPQNQ